MRTSQRGQHALWVEVREERETCRLELEKKKNVLARLEKELLKQEAQNDYEKKKFEDEKKQYAARDANLQSASMEQKKTDENLMKLCDDHKREKEGAQKNHKKLEDMQNLKLEIEKKKRMPTTLLHVYMREKEEAHRKVLDMQKTLEDKQNLEVEIKRLKGKIQIMGYMEGDEVRDKMHSMRTLLEEKETELDDLDQLNTTLLAKERIANDELQEARKEMIVEIINEEEEKLKELKAEWGEGIYEAVVTALKELNEYNASGRYPIKELWNFKAGRKASLKEATQHLIKSCKLGKRKR